MLSSLFVLIFADVLFFFFFIFLLSCIVAEDDETEFTQLKTKDPGQTSLPDDNGGSTRSFILLAVIFLTAVLLVGVVYHNFPKLEP